MKQFLYSVLIILSTTAMATAGEKIQVDNDNIQHYRGTAGKWEMPGSMNRLRYLVRKYQSTLYKVKRINGSLNCNSYLFIPFSGDYREKIISDSSMLKTVKSGENRYIWPLNRVERISSHFGMRWGQLHTGVDLPAPAGTPIVATRDGRVISAGYASGHGKSICLEHRGNFFTRYSHNSVMLVKKGELVKKGQIIALVGCTGNSTGNHLHFEIRYRNIPLNPLDFLPEQNQVESIHHITRLGKHQ